jgi:hypothetical protein
MGIVKHGVDRTHVRSIAQQVNAVDDLVDRGRLSAAMTIVDRMHAAADGNPPPTPPSIAEQLEKLAALHPAATVDDVLPPTRTSVAMEDLDAKEFSFRIQKLRTAATPGWTGWTNALIRRVSFNNLHSERLLGAMRKFVNRSMQGKLGVEAAALLTASRAVLIPKDGGGLRPLGIGEAWYRLISKCMCAAVVAKVSGKLAPLQLGSGFSGGVEICARLPQLALAGDDGVGVDACIFTFDVENAFNSTRRNLILAGIREHCPEIEPWFRLMYGGPSELRLSSGLLAGVSASGVRQGDPMSMILFALAFQVVLLAINQALTVILVDKGYRAQDGYVEAYADDISGSCPASCIPAFGGQVKTILEEHHLTLVPRKCALYGRLARNIQDPEFPVLLDGIPKVVGCPVGPAPFRQAVIERKLAAMTASLPTLKTFNPQAAYMLIAHCVNARASFLSRVTELPADIIKTLFDKFDTAIDEALARLADCPHHLRDQLRTLRRLPQKMGGLGIYDYAGLQGLKGRNQSRLKVHEFTTANYHSSLYRQTNVATWGALDLGDEGDDELNHTDLASVAAFSKRVQLARRVECATIQGEKAVSCKAEAAWFLSSCTPNSGRWLSWRGGLSHRFRMSSQLFVDAIRRRLLCPPTPHQLAAARVCCTCSTASRAHPTHLLDCPRNQWLFARRHAVICKLLAKYIAQVCDDSLITMEAAVGQGPNPMRADIVAEIGARVYTLDVSLTNPSNRTNLSHNSHQVSDRAAINRENTKRDKDGHIPGLEAGGDRTFTPFVIESTGRLAPSAQAFFNKITAQEFISLKSTFLNSLSACIALYNSLMLRCAKRRLGVLENFEL